MTQKVQTQTLKHRACKQILNVHSCPLQATVTFCLQTVNVHRDPGSNNLVFYYEGQLTHGDRKHSAKVIWDFEPKPPWGTELSLVVAHKFMQ